jgi:hypothetical protein
MPEPFALTKPERIAVGAALGAAEPLHPAEPVAGTIAFTQTYLGEK